MKYRYLSIILLILIFSVGAVCAQDDATGDVGIVSAGSDDVMSLDDNAVLLQDNGLSEDEIHINDDNYNQYFDESGIINSNVSANSDLYIGNITNKTLNFDKTVNIFAEDSSSVLVESTISFITGSNGSFVEGLTFNNNEVTAISVMDVSDITIFDNIISVISNVNNSASAILADFSKNLNISANVVTFNGKTDGYTPINAMGIVECDDIIIEDNVFEITIPSAPIIWNEDPPGSYNYIPNPTSEGIYISTSNGVSFKRNHISLNASDVIGEGDSIYVVEFSESDDAQIVENIIEGEGHQYIYGLVIRGDNFTISGNEIAMDSDAKYANGMDIEGGSTGVVEENIIFVSSPYVAYGIYSMYNYATFEAPAVDYTDNLISGDSHAVYGMSLYGSEANIVGNSLELFGNYTMGISSMMIDGAATITDNDIMVFGEKNDTADVGDMLPAQTVGIFVMSESEIYNNAITSSGNYTIVSSSNDGEITGNYLVASELLGDESVLDTTADATVENNIPNEDNDYILTNDTFFLFFNENGVLRDGITGNLTFIGEFSDLILWMIIDRPINLSGDNATLFDMSFNIISENVTIDGFNFISDSIADVITVEADNV